MSNVCRAQSVSSSILTLCLLPPAGQQVRPDQKRAGDVEHQHAGPDLPGNHPPSGRPLPLHVHPHHPHRPEAAEARLRLGSRWVKTPWMPELNQKHKLNCSLMGVVVVPSGFGVLQSRVWLGESSCHVRSHQHCVQAGSSGPPKAAKMYHDALRVCWNVSFITQLHHIHHITKIKNWLSGFSPS